MFFIFLASFSELGGTNLSEREIFLIDHVKQSIEKASRHESRLDPAVFTIHGMSSYKIRHLLNNLCSLDHTRYLEIGSWKGSTFIAALFNNQDTLDEAISIENFSEFCEESPYYYFTHNLGMFLGTDYPYQLVIQDCFTVDKSSVFTSPINIYFFDGNHSYESQYKAFTYYNDVFDDVFIAMVDDWNFGPVEPATKNAFKDLGYKIIYENILPSNGNSDMLNWWNGFYIAVIRK